VKINIKRIIFSSKIGMGLSEEKTLMNKVDLISIFASRSDDIVR